MYVDSLSRSVVTVTVISIDSMHMYEHVPTTKVGICGMDGVEFDSPEAF